MIKVEPKSFTKHLLKKNKGKTKMNNEKIKRIENTMEDVIETSKKMRNPLLDETIDFEERSSKLKVFKTALEANKNIVSASLVNVHIEEFKL